MLLPPLLPKVRCRHPRTRNFVLVSGSMYDEHAKLKKVFAATSRFDSVDRDMLRAGCRLEFISGAHDLGHFTR